MIIGVDADGVLTDMQEFNFQCGKEYFKKGIVNPEGYSVKEIFGVGKWAELFFGLKYFPWYCKAYPPRENAVKILNRLKEEGHTIHEITARKFVTQKSLLGKCSKKWFLNWCKENGFSFDSITFCSEKTGPQDKYDACKKYGVEVMIDDRPEIVLYLAGQGIPVIMIDAPYNQKVQHENVMRVHDWSEVYEVLRERQGICL